MGEPSAAAVSSVEDLRSVSTAVSKFIVTWDGVRSLLDSINSSMDSLSAQLDATAGILPHSSPIKSPQAEAVEIEAEDNCDTDDNALSDKEEGSSDGPKPESEPESRRKLPRYGLDIESICNSKTLKGGTRLRRHVIARLPSGAPQMYNEIPPALARAQDPAVLVLGCVGQFFKQGKNTFLNPVSQESYNRRAAILVLECFLLSGSVVPENQLAPPLRQQAHAAALAWRDRMRSEGGVDKAGAEDALGLVLLLASFGIPPRFGKQDIANLIQLCNLKKKVGVLRQSPNLAPKVPEIIEDMVKDGKHLAATELVIAFELEGKFPLLPLLSSHLDAIKREGTDGQKGQDAARTMKQALEKQRSKLQSLANFLTDHNLHTEYASFDLDATICKVEKDVISIHEQKPDAKKNTEETASLEKRETHPRPPQNLKAKRKFEETAPLETIGSVLKPPRIWTNHNASSVTSLTNHPIFLHNPVNMQMNNSPLGRSETHSKPPQIQNANNKAEETAPLARIETRPQPPQNLIAKREAEGTVSLDRTETGPRPPPLCAEISNIAVSLNMQDSTSLRRPSLEHPHSVPGPMFMQMNCGPASTSPLNADSRFAGFLNRDTVPPVGYSTPGYLGNGLPIGGGYAPPSAYHGSEPYNRYRGSDSSAVIPPAHHAFGLSQPGGGIPEEYRGAYPEVHALSADQNMLMHVPLPREIRSTARGSASRYNFADMV